MKFLPTATKPGKYDSQHHEFYLHVYTDDPGDGNRKPQPSGGFMGGRGVMMPLKAYCEGKGVRILLEHKVTDVYKNADGRVIGARVEAGGLSINDNAQVLDIVGKPIEGLYAAGENCGGIYVGNGMPRGIIPGRWAGEHAARAKAA